MKPKNVMVEQKSHDIAVCVCVHIYLCVYMHTYTHIIFARGLQGKV